MLHAHNPEQHFAAPLYLLALSPSLSLSFSHRKLLIISVSGQTRPMAPLPLRCSNPLEKCPLYYLSEAIYRTLSSLLLFPFVFRSSLPLVRSPLSSFPVFAPGLTSKANSKASIAYVCYDSSKLTIVGKRFLSKMCIFTRNWYIIINYIF